MRKHLATAVAAVSLAMAGQAVYADMNAAKKWIDNEFQPSALSKSDQAKEMEWFIKAAEPFRGM
ncbi:MAG: carbohydrate ABC transporter substrate-binding protein, partial [Litorivicinaceae bacterium]